MLDQAGYLFKLSKKLFGPIGSTPTGYYSPAYASTSCGTPSEYYLTILDFIILNPLQGVGLYSAIQFDGAMCFT